MAAANDNQGLKIAVAIFVTFTVILAVTTYFGFSNAAQAEEKQHAADAAVVKEKQLAGDAVNALTDFKKLVGYEKVEAESAPLAAAFKKSRDEEKAQINAVAEAVKGAFAEYKSAGGNDKKVEELNQGVNQMVDTYNSEPNQTLVSGAQRAIEILQNESKLVVALTLDNEQLRRDLESVNKVNAEGNSVVVADRDKSKADLEAVIAAHNQQLTGLRAQIDQLQTSLNTSQQDVAKLQTQLRETTESASKRQEDLLVQLKFFREQSERRETVLDKPNGRVTYVDLNHKEVRVNLTRSKGAKPQMLFTIFDKNAPGQPTDKPAPGVRPGTIQRVPTPPKGTIELTYVGEQDSVGRIVSMAKPSDPIRMGDQVYSPAFGLQRFALIGRMDIDRDGRDDREDLKRMIQSAGGVVDYDLAPSGGEIGKVTGLTSWYVLDDRETLRPETKDARSRSGNDDKAFLDKKTEAIKDARLLGVRPIPIERLLAMLNWSYGMAVPGRIEAVDATAIDNLLHPKGGKGVLPGAPNPADAPKEETKEVNP